MTQTSLGSVSNSGSNDFTNKKSAISKVNYGRIIGSINNYEFNMQNFNNKNIDNPKKITYSLWSGTYNENIIYN